MKRLDPSNAPPRFSLILPSYNGQETLPDCLKALQRLHHPKGEVEFILVDNCSSDTTAELLKEAALSLGGQFLAEDRQGKSFALNSAIAVARGDFLIFTDDDTLADENWLNAYAKAIEDHPQRSVFAGQIRPAWRAKVPVWLNELADRGQVCGCTPYDREEGPYPPQLVKGANVMIRKEAFNEHAFDTETVNFGANSAQIGGEDSKLMQELVAAGEEIIYVPDARLEHIVQERETTLPFILQRQMRIGRGNAASEGIGMAAALRICGEIGAYILAAPALFVLGYRAAAVHQLMKMARRAGMIQLWYSRLFG